MDENTRSRKRWWAVDVGIGFLSLLGVPVCFLTLAGPVVLLQRFGQQWFPESVVGAVGDPATVIAVVAIFGISILLAARLWLLLVEYTEVGWRGLSPLGMFLKVAVPILIPLGLASWAAVVELRPGNERAKAEQGPSSGRAREARR